MLSNYLFVYLLIILLFNAALINLPLTNVFGYEFSAANSVLLSLLSGIFCIKVLKKNETAAGIISNQKKILITLFISYGFFLAVPLVVGLVNSLFETACSLSEGFSFYIVITFPSVLIGAGIGILVFSIFNKLRIIFFIAAAFLILFVPLLEFYFYPQVYFYNPIFGYLPGTIYDEAVIVNSTLIIYRILNVVYFVGIFICFWKLLLNQITISRKAVSTVTILIAVLFIFVSPRLNFATDQKRIQSVLKGKIETPHFTIYYSEEVDKKLIKDIAVHHEYYYKELSVFFEDKLDEKITSFLFLNSEQKKNLFGSGSADVAKPWLLQIFTVYENYNKTLKHEIAHCFTAAFAEGIFKAADNFNPSLIEGAAVAADPIYDENNIAYMAALAFQNGYKVHLEDIYSFLNFFKNPSTVSYVYAGAFTRFLIDKYGIEKFKQLYRNLDFNKVYGTGLDSLETQFYSVLKLIKNEGRDAKADYYFGRVSIFYKVCPRYAAAQLKRGWSYFENGEYQKSKHIFSELLEITNSYSAIVGLARTYVKLGSFSPALELLNRSLDNFENSAYYYGILLNLADILAMKGSFDEAERYYEDIVSHKPNRTYYYISRTRKNLLGKDTLITLYLNGSAFDKFIILRHLNSKSYDYDSFPILIDLAKSIDIEYEIFIGLFDETIHVTNYSSSYAMYKLSNYMLENLNFSNARKMAALSLRFNADKNFAFILKNNYEKTNWFYFNAQKILNQIKIN